MIRAHLQRQKIKTEFKIATKHSFLVGSPPKPHISLRLCEKTMQLWEQPVTAPLHHVLWNRKGCRSQASPGSEAEALPSSLYRGFIFQVMLSTQSLCMTDELHEKSLTVSL